MQRSTRAKVTVEQINAAIEQLNNEGTKPTIRAVRERLGNTGSPNRIQPLLAAWNDKNKPAETEQVTLSESAKKTLANLITTECSVAITEKLEEIEDLKAQLEEVTKAGQQLEDDNDYLEGLSAQVDEEKNKATTLAGARQQRIEQLEAELAHSQLQNKEQVQHLATIQANLTMELQQRQHLEQSLERQTAALAETQKHVSAAQQVAAVAEAKQQAALETAKVVQERVARLEKQLEQSQQAAAAKIDALQRRVDEMHQQRTLDAQAHTKLLAQRDEQLYAEHEKNRQLMSRVDELSDKLEAAKSTKRKAVK